MGQRVSILQHLGTAALLIAVAAIVRVMCFSGFVLGDDPAYGDFVSHIVEGGYPPMGSHSVFSCRPVLLYLIAASIQLLGWTEWGFVLPIFFASLTITLVVYLAGVTYAGWLGGVLAAGIYLSFPLDLVHATTMTNDILLSCFVWFGALLWLFSYTKYHQKAFLVVSFGSGLILGASVGIKINALVVSFLLCAMVVFALRKELRNGAYKTVLAWGLGWLLSNILLCYFFDVHSGDFFAHYHVEMRFNLDNDPSGYARGHLGLLDFLLFYPGMIFGFYQEGHANYRFMPYGYVFFCFFVILPALFFKRFSSLRVPALLALALLFVMEFAPISLFPNYIPIHRQIRFLSLLAPPICLALGVFFSICLRNQSRIVSIGYGAVYLFLILSSFYWAGKKALFFQDCAKDQRWVWNHVKTSSTDAVIADTEIANYLLFRYGYAPPKSIPWLSKLPKDISPNSWVVSGGARRPDLAPEVVAEWGKLERFPKKKLLFQALHSLTPWRLSPLEIYLIE